MKSNKEYSNVTFTKRVDKEAGRHRTLRSPSEPLVCEGCGSVLVGRRWKSASAAEAQTGHKHWRPAKSTICPACLRKREQDPGGLVYLLGSFALTHQNEIECLAGNEAARAAKKNPLARIIEWGKDPKGGPCISTTTPFLARRIARALARAFGGSVHYSFSHENKLVRVRWTKE